MVIFLFIYFTSFFTQKENINKALSRTFAKSIPSHIATIRNLNFLTIMRLISLCLSFIIPAAMAAECAGVGSVRKLLLIFDTIKG